MNVLVSWATGTRELSTEDRVSDLLQLNVVQSYNSLPLQWLQPHVCIKKTISPILTFGLFWFYWSRFSTRLNSLSHCLMSLWMQCLGNELLLFSPLSRSPIDWLVHQKKSNQKLFITFPNKNVNHLFYSGLLNVTIRCISVNEDSLGFGQDKRHHVGVGEIVMMLISVRHFRVH